MDGRFILTKKTGSKKYGLAGVCLKDACLRDAQKAFEAAGYPTIWEPGYNVSLEYHLLNEKMYKGKATTYQELIA